MARHVDAWMDGRRLADLGAITIQEVTESAPDQEITYGNRAVRDGRDVIKNRRRSLKVTIDAVILEVFDLSKRLKITQAIAGWANGTYLELSNHPGQRLRVISRMAPSLGTVRNYTAAVKIELEANEVPFWENRLADSVSGTGASGSTTLRIGGTCPRTPVMATFTPSSSMASLTVTVSCGGVTRSIQLTGMSGTGAVAFGYDENDRLTIMRGSTSLLRYRTEASADDLIVPAGAATVSWSASVSGSMVFSARGRWL